MLHTRSKNIPLSYWKKTKVGNLGDELSPYIVQHISNCNTIYVSPETPGKLCAIGSWFNRETLASGGYFWGTGLHKELSPRQSTDGEVIIKAVRGPITRKLLLEAGYDCPAIYGDPALLMPKFYSPSVNKKYKLGIIPHYVHLGLLNVASDIKIITPERNFDEIETFVDELCECEMILSSSLHGIILAHAYGIPAQYFVMHNHPLNYLAGIKFSDYFLSVGQTPQKPLKFIENQHINLEIINAINKNINLDVNLKLLINSFPYELIS